MMFEVVFTEVYFEEYEYFKTTKMIIAKSIEELMTMFFDFNKLSICIFSAKVVDSITNYQRACRKEGAVIVLERKKKINSEEAVQLIYGCRS